MARPGLFARLLPPYFKETWLLRGFAAIKIPLLFYLRPNVVALDAERAVLRIKLRRRSRNHMGSMYLAALTAGADVASALMALQQVRAAGAEVVPIFSDMRAEFYKRADGDVLFTCTEGETVRDMVAEVLRGEGRVGRSIKVTVTVPDKYGEEPVATFVMGLSLKLKKGAAAADAAPRPMRASAP